MIRLTSHRDIGQLLKRLRENAGLTQRQLGKLAHVTSSGLAKRERTNGITTYGLINHVRPLGYEVVLIPIPLEPGEIEQGRRTPGDTSVWFRSTGTGWPDAGALTPDRRTAA